MTTARDIATTILRKAGVVGDGRTPSASDINDTFRDINGMIAQWRRKRWLVYTLVDTNFTSTGAQFYTVGLGGNFAISPRPDRIEYAYMVQPNVSPGNPVSYPLNLLEAREDYAAIGLKSLVAWPTHVYFDPDFPTGKLYVWPIGASGQYRYHILTKKNLPRFENLSDEMILPEEYEEAIIWNGVIRAWASYPRAQADPTQTANIKGLAKDSLNLIRNANTQVPRLKLPGFLYRQGRGYGYDIYSDNNG